MVSRTYQTAAVAALNNTLTLDQLCQLLQDDVPAFKAELEQLPPAEKFQLLSQANNDGDYLLHDVLYSLCNPERADIPGNDPDLIDCVLSGLRRKQRVHLLCLHNDSGYTPFDILASQENIREEFYLTSFRKLCARLTPEQKYNSLQTTQTGFGTPLGKLVRDSSAAALDIIRERLGPSLFAKLLVTPNVHLEYPLVKIIENGNLEFLKSCLDGISGKERCHLISATCGTTSAITQAVQVSSLDITKALLEGLDETQRSRAYSTQTSEQTSPRIILEGRLGRVHDLTQLFNASSENLSDPITQAFNSFAYNSATGSSAKLENNLFDLNQAISGRGGDPIVLIQNLSDLDLWAIIGGKNHYSTRPIDSAISSGNLNLLNEIANRTPVSVMKSLLMDEEGQPCFSLIKLIKSSNTNRIGRLKILLKDFSRADRQELFNAKDKNGASIQSLIQEEESAVRALVSCFLNCQPQNRCPEPRPS